MRRGVTFIEILLVVAITAILAGVTVVNLLGKRSGLELQTTTRQIVALLREAQSNSINQASSTSWGVRFENGTSTAPFYALFFGAYATTTRSGYYRLPPNVRYATSSIPQGSSTNVLFSQITGFPLATTTVVLELLGGGTVASSVIQVSRNGSITH
ncbi:prepilin-type N-terminal cleavage/methylation domain-containing protein [Candidatus Parcubacteria bacterium]|nr:MAG: prepilin-type N-terminal cleavage/methylation domain-containing protein [Candidatus Parcubacteria bacterium]